MALVDHIAIITHSSLAAAVVNKLNPTKPAEFFAQIAFPPEAGAELMALCNQAAGGQPLQNFQIAAGTNEAKGQKQLPGVPGNWLVVRASTQYAPYVAAADGSQLDQANPQHAQVIKTAYYAGRKIRAALSAYAWTFGGKQGISFNLVGIMDAGEEGERLNIGLGATVNAFAAHAKPGATTGNVAAMNANAEVKPANNDNPFAQGGAAAQNAIADGAAKAAGANPFAPGASGRQSVRVTPPDFSDWDDDIPF